MIKAINNIVLSWNHERYKDVCSPYLYSVQYLKFWLNTALERNKRHTNRKERNYPHLLTKGSMLQKTLRILVESFYIYETIPTM